VEGNYMVKGEKHLVTIYNRFNSLYFNGSLPPVAIYYEPISDTYGDCTRREDGVFQIRLNPSISGWESFLKTTILHECIHIRLWPNVSHGAKFDKEVKRLMEFKSVRKMVI
jgi:predicted SprT family Zn-dependent metalloprotease